MVASVAALKSAGQAASYYEADDYYTEGGEAPSAWFGEGAKALGLEGEVDRATFAAGLEGRLPNGDQLGTVRNGEREHRPGWDVTFRGDYTKVTYLHGKGERIANVTRQVGS